VEALQGVRSVAMAVKHGLAVMQSGVVFSWGRGLLPTAKNQLRPVPIEGFGMSRMRHVFGELRAAFAIGEKGELFSWGVCEDRGILGHCDRQN
jgi:hypothetical protein